MGSAPARVLLDFSNVSRPFSAPEHLNIDLLPIERIKNIASNDAPVLVRGENGTGKSVAAWVIHKHSQRAGPFVRIDCRVLAARLESEFLGRERDAFNNMLAYAEGGTIFLAQIDHLSLYMQVILHGVLEERKILEEKKIQYTRNLTKSGGRVIAATNIDLERAIDPERAKEGEKFSGGLYYLLNINRVQIPPLREKIKDIGSLASDFISQLAHDVFTTLPLSAPAKEALLAYHWPGNIREFKNALEQANFKLNPNTTEILLEHLPAHIPQALATSGVPAATVEDDLKSLCAIIEDTGHQIGLKSDPIDLITMVHELGDVFLKSVLMTRFRNNGHRIDSTAFDLGMKRNTFTKNLTRLNESPPTDALLDKSPELP